MSSPSKSPAPPPLVGNLGVHVREGRDEQELDPTSTRYQIVEAIVHLALTLLETREGRRSLTEVATAIIQERKAYAAAGRRRPQGHIYEDSLANMPIWIDTFLRRMRRNFPPVLIGRTDGEASAAKRDWGTDMNAYQAGHDAGVLWVKDSIISNMVYVRQQPRDIAGDSYILYKFQMVISVAHEIVHFLTGFLTGTMRPHTPPRVTAKPYGNPYGDTTRSGEAGRYWEHDFLGGFLEMWSLPDDPLDVRQPGVPFLFLSGKLGEATGREISMAYIDEFLNKQFSFPIRTSTRTRPITRNQLRRLGRLETSVLRGGPAFRAAGRVDSPEPGAAREGSEPRFRRIITDSVSGYSGSGYGGSGYSGSGYSGSGYSGSGSGGGNGYRRPSYR